MSARASRDYVGEFFSEAARQLWSKLPAFGSVAALAAKIGRPKATIWRLLYGERRAGRHLAQDIQETLGIRTSLWDEPPRKPFRLPKIARATKKAA